MSNVAKGVRVALTPEAEYGSDYSQQASSVLSPDDCRQAHAFAQLLPGYAPTPLVDWREMADECSVTSLSIKHEGHRSPTHSFKVLGPPYALGRELVSRLGLSVADFAALTSGQLSSSLRGITACAATSGNHGRALAWASTRFGCRCQIFMPQATGAYREQQIQHFGAVTTRVPGNYDDAVYQAVSSAKEKGHVLVGDGAAEDSAVLRHIIHGYSVVGEELVAAMRSQYRPTHVFVSAGSGSLVAAITGRLWMEFGRRRPKVVVVQPHRADSGYQSCLNSRRTASRGDLTTIMDGLSVAELSPSAWTILRGGAFGFITIDDDEALTTLRLLQRHGRLDMGETGVAALAGFRASAADVDARQQLGLDQDSRVIVVATEGVTDPQVVSDLLTL